MKDAAIGSAGRNKYVGLKWLMFLHEGLQLTRNADVVVLIAEIVEEMVFPAAKSRFERYLLQKLVMPYRQYLQKMAEVVSVRMREGSPAKGAERDGSVVFREYNLMSFAYG
jgi:hypothetical protein